jgi:hypothetical protein
MARQSQPPSTAHHSRILHSRPSFRFAVPVPFMSYIQPFCNQLLPYSYVSRSACKPRKISNLRILSVATEVCPCRKQKREQRVCASMVNGRLFSSLQPLSVSLRSFSSPRPLFSATYRLFSRNTRVGGGSTQWIFGINGQPLLVLPVPGGWGAHAATWRTNGGHSEPAGDRGTVTARTFVAAAGVVLGFALQDAARAAQVPALLTSSRSRSAQSSTWRGKLAATQRRDAKKAGFSLRSRRRI